MTKQTFADDLGGITVAGQTVRLDFVVIAPNEPDGPKQARLVFQERLILPIEGFLKAARIIQEAAQALSKMSTEHKEAEENRIRPIKSTETAVINKNETPQNKIFP